MDQTLSASTLVWVPLAPLIGSVLVGIFGTAMGGNLLGRKACHSITILGVLVAFLLSAWTLCQVLGGASFNQTLYTWMVLGNVSMEVGFQIDSLSAMMMCVVTFVSLMVHLYTIGYMDGDPGYNRFFSYISLFTFSMLMLVMSNNMLQLFFGWEAVGLVSYLLIGFWYKKSTAVFANLKAFLINRVGDFGFILGIGLLVAQVGSFNYNDVFAQADQLAPLTLTGTDWSLLTVALICLFIGAMGKSAQFPLHVWLPDSMEGPTPISALIHAATMVTAGIFMVARFSPLYELSDAALNFILVIGAITAFFMGLLGLIQNDIKRVVAYSTLSQLGYMTVALGASAYNVAVFHLMTHAFFKALLFLGAGSVIMGVHHNQDMRYMGGLWKYMPITWITSLLGSLALIGTPFFSGFYSKDAIIEAVHASNLPASGIAYWAVLSGVFITAFYSFRMYFLVFHGKERYDQDPHAHDHHHDDDGHGHHDSKPHESPWVVTVPLVLLAIPSVGIGGYVLMDFLFGDFFNGVTYVNDAIHPAMHELREEIHGAVAMGLHAFSTAPFWLALAGVIGAWYCYLVNPKVPQFFMKTFHPVYRLFEEKYYMDRLWIDVIGGGFTRLGKLFWKAGDQAVIDGAVVNGSWKLVGWVAGIVRWFQTGYIYYYALVMILGVFALMTYFVWLAK
ncbi:NADH-quinone oxidoreductase subunit L [Corticibacter populi]|uniref:NADH-quinone oxidoreductase subunit L n=1 Tax=Corticibacter populi TaxID=1550736 RepID=A0A3M6QX90_9BURK|nr:NADH-quinone oxidoreductase subunit L [Corticibacter populi]RMX07627.1 NADH-quinone oxidoreductase subunit L [Corticibacter populi]RZS30128.1 NADH dehydrogenase subunit L [Corticibacter populi]